MRIAVLGGSGRTGGRVVEAIGADPTLVLGPVFSRSNPLTSAALRGVHALIDFSLPDALAGALPHLGSIPLVTGTTGLDVQTQALVDRHATHAPVLQAANFSAGVTLMLDLAATAARVLPDYDLEIVEAHHRHKRDAPSGTALALAQAAANARGVDPNAVVRHGHSAGQRTAGTIAIHALRAGGIVGEHTFLLVAESERITLGHVASSRNTFAEGAIRGARWLSGRAPGAYTMRQVLFVP